MRCFLVILFEDLEGLLLVLLGKPQSRKRLLESQQVARRTVLPPLLPYHCDLGAIHVRRECAMGANSGLFRFGGLGFAAHTNPPPGSIKGAFRMQLFRRPDLDVLSVLPTRVWSST
jgi:hypothetical protein